MGRDCSWARHHREGPRKRGINWIITRYDVRIPPNLAVHDFAPNVCFGAMKKIGRTTGVGAKQQGLAASGQAGFGLSG